ncbi:VOC family protein [Ectothiorhodospiraceae bacterium 2226]|nr:VOC family protein [Ectothiorhodospiraceae bacterium 2226]
MKPRISMITLGVADVGRAARFYEQGLGLPRHPVEEPDGGSEPSVAFFALDGTWLSLYGRETLAQDAGVPSAERSAGFSLAHNVSTRDEVDAVLRQAVGAGARLIKPAQDTFWGGYAGYFADLDGHLWEVAWNPHFWVGPADPD